MQRTGTPTRQETSTSFYRMMPGIKLFDYNEFDVMRDVAAYFKVEEKDMRARGRRRVNVLPRQTAMYFIAMMFPKLKYEYIGSLFTGKDHATVTHSVKTVKELNFSDKHYCYQLKELGEIIHSRILKVNETKG